MSFEKQKIKKERVTLTIDGKSITASSDKTVLEVALDNGIYIPSLCWLKKLRPIGSCRICIVEVEGADEPMTSCQMPVMDDLKIITKSEKLTELRKDMARMMLVNHPVDCPICERSGECELQNKTYEFGLSWPEYKADPVKRTKKWTEWGLIRYEPNLCVLCERCIRVCREVQGVDAYRISKKGFDSVIDTKDGGPLDCDFCGQCISVCPVGALNSSLVIKGRSWDFTKVKSVCGYCGVGCSLTLDIKQGKLVRVTSDDDAGSNNGNLCVRGRFGYEFVNHKARLTAPLIRKGNRLEQVTWDEAITFTAEKLKEIIKVDGGGAIGAIGSERVANEDNYLLQKICRAVIGTNLIDNISNLKNRSFGSRLFSDFSQSPLITSDEILKGGVFLAFGADLGEENPVVGNMIRRAIRDNEAHVIMAHPQKVSFNPAPDIRVQYNIGSEIELINAIIKEIVNKKAVKAEAGKVTNLDDFTGYLGNFNANNTGVSDDEVKNIASMIVKKGNLVILAGNAVYNNPEGKKIVQALQNLSVLIDGKFGLFREFCNTQGVNDMGVCPENGPGYQSLADAEVVSRLNKKWGCEISGTISEKNVIENAHGGLLKALIVMGEDVVSRYCDGKFVRDALNKIDFLVAFDSFSNETIRMADVVFPSATFAEKDGTMTNMEGRIQKLNLASKPQGEARAEWKILNAIAQKMGCNFNYTSSVEILNEIGEVTSLYSGLTDQAIGVSGKVLDYGKENGTITLKLVESLKKERLDKEHPFFLSIGNSKFHFPPFSQLSERISMYTADCFAEINEEDAKEIGISEGDSVTVESSNGARLNFVAKLTDKSGKGTVYIPSLFSDRAINTLFSDNCASSMASLKKME